MGRLKGDQRENGKIDDSQVDARNPFSAGSTGHTTTSKGAFQRREGSISFSFFFFLSLSMIMSVFLRKHAHSPDPLSEWVG